MRSTTHAVCCGTNRTTVLAGSRDFWKYVGRGPEAPPLPGLLPKPMELGRKEPVELLKRRAAAGIVVIVVVVGYVARARRSWWWLEPRCRLRTRADDRDAAVRAN
jgi:hypothetical protein